VFPLVVMPEIPAIKNATLGQGRMVCPRMFLLVVMPEIPASQTRSQRFGLHDPPTGIPADG